MHRFVASGFGTGLILPKLRNGDAGGSGTLGALVGLGVAWALSDTAWWAVAMLAAVAVLLSLWSAGPFAVDGSDPGWVVIDEVAGMLVAGIGLGGGPLLVAFVVFRVADISKRFPGVAAAERLRGAAGITADDVVAGLWGLAAGWASTLAF
jgi:phosphatidylglycerophosphatase A